MTERWAGQPLTEWDHLAIGGPSLSHRPLLGFTAEGTFQLAGRGSLPSWLCWELRHQLVPGCKRHARLLNSPMLQH